MLPFLFSLGLPALAPAIGLGALSTPVLSGIGAGLGSFLETGDVGKGIKTGLLAGLSGRLLGGIGGGVKGLEGTASQQAMMTPTEFGTAAAGLKAPQLMSGLIGEKAATGLLQPGLMTAATVGSMASSAQNQPESRKSDDDDFEAPMPNPPQKVVDFSGDPLDTSKEKNYFDYIFKPQPDLEYPYIDYGTAQEEFRRPRIDRPIPFSMGGFMGGSSNPMFMGLGQGIRRAMASQDNEKVDAFVQKVENDARAEFGDIFQPQQVPMAQFGLAEFQQARPLDRQFRPKEVNTTDEFLRGFGGGGRNPNYTGPKTEIPIPGKGGGIKPVGNMFQRALGFAEGGEIEGMNEKDIILEAILAIKGMKSLEEAQMILGKFLSENGEDALRDLIKSVKSGEYDDTVARFAAGEKGMVRGPSDGSGKDDKVPATMDNQQDVLLTEGEFVMRKPTTDALTKAYGGGFLDKINEAEKDAPKVLEKMVG